MMRRFRLRVTAVLAAVPALLGSMVLAGSTPPAYADPVTEFTSSFTHEIGRTFTITNHLVDTPATHHLIGNLNALTGGEADLPTDLAKLGGERVMTKQAGGAHEYMVVWAGDMNIADLETGHGGELNDVPGFLGDELGRAARSPVTPLVGPDFLAVIDVQKGTPSYGKVVNTVTVPLAENEPHHMQYIWHKGDTIFAGGLFTDVAFALDVTNIPVMTLKGVNLPVNTPCGSVPDAFWLLEDGTAYGTWMGGPNLPGPCRYTNGEVRTGNGFAGAPGSVVYLDKNGKTISESPSATPGMEPNPRECLMTPPIGRPSCANPHGIQAREDLDRMITGDFAQPSMIIGDPLPALPPLDTDMVRRTVRTWDISDRANPKVESVARLPDGPRPTPDPQFAENLGFMEATVTNEPEHKGAFAASMCAGAVYYNPDITDKSPQWRLVFDQATILRQIQEKTGARFADGGCEGSGWLQTSLDDKYLYNVVMGRRANTTAPGDPGTPGMLFALDIRKLLAAGSDYKCNIDTVAESYHGGAEKDCPTVRSVLPVEDPTSGGPHWGALDNFKQNPDGTFSEIRGEPINRIAYSNYFVARTGWDGDHKVCMANIKEGHQFELAKDFRDEFTGQPCVDFDRLNWPHGPWGDAKPHSMVFVVRDAAIRE